MPAQLFSSTFCCSPVTPTSSEVMSGSDTSVGYVVFGETPGVPIQTCIVQPLHLMMYRPCFSSADTPNVVALICCQLLVSAFCCGTWKEESSLMDMFKWASKPHTLPVGGIAPE